MQTLLVVKSERVHGQKNFPKSTSFMHFGHSLADLAHVVSAAKELKAHVTAGTAHMNNIQ